MRPDPSIISLSLIIVLGVLHIQALFIDYRPKNVQAQEQAVCCSKKKACPKKEDSSKEKEDCNNHGCNPFVPCSMGNCCYVVENFFSTKIFTDKKSKFAVLNDDKLLNAASECWHPPEAFS